MSAATQMVARISHRRESTSPALPMPLVRLTVAVAGVDWMVDIGSSGRLSLYLGDE
jgi:hypothetical protein